jgi:hypothetical protein
MASLDLEGPGGRPGPRLMGAAVVAPAGVKFLLLSSLLSDFRLAMPEHDLLHSVMFMGARTIMVAVPTYRHELKPKN